MSMLQLIVRCIRNGTPNTFSLKLRLIGTFKITALLI